MLEGEVSIHHGSRGVRVVRKDEALLETMDWPHNTRNVGTTPASILVLRMGVQAGTVTEPASRQ